MSSFGFMADAEAVYIAPAGDYACAEERSDEQVAEGGAGALAPGHSGVYAGAAVASGTVFLDAPSIREIEDVAAAEAEIEGRWAP